MYQLRFIGLIYKIPVNSYSLQKFSNLKLVQTFPFKESDYSQILSFSPGSAEVYLV